jgi:hypothetical protein
MCIVQLCISTYILNKENAKPVSSVPCWLLIFCSIADGLLSFECERQKKLVGIWQKRETSIGQRWASVYSIYLILNNDCLPLSQTSRKPSKPFLWNLKIWNWTRNKKFDRVMEGVHLHTYVSFSSQGSKKLKMNRICIKPFAVRNLQKRREIKPQGFNSRYRPFNFSWVSTLPNIYVYVL